MKKQSGFTLIELLIYMGILSILLLILVQLFGSVIDVQIESQTTSIINQDGAFLLNRLSYDINRADDISSPNLLGIQDQSLQLSVNGSLYTYSVANGTLNLLNGSTNATDALTSADNKISDFHITRLGNTIDGAPGKQTVQISFTLESKSDIQKGEQPQTFQTTVGLR